MSRVRRRGKNWQLDFYANGRRYRRSLGEMTKAKAEEVAREYEQQVITGRLGFETKKSPLLREFCQDYFEYSKANHAPKTSRDIAFTFGKNLIPYFGDRRLSEIDFELVEKFKLSRRGRISDSTVNKDLRYLRAMLNYAKSVGKIDANKMAGVKLLRTTTCTGRILDESEIGKIESCSHFLRPLFLTAIHTGLRANELFNLTWDDVDFDEKTITVKAKGDWHPKNYKNRVVPMTERLYDILLQTHKRGHEYVFTYENGRKIKDVRSTIRKICDELDIEIFTMHDLRRTFATFMGHVGGDILSVKEAMGHSDVRTTMGYMRTGLDRIRKTVNKLPFAEKQEIVD